MRTYWIGVGLLLAAACTARDRAVAPTGPSFGMSGSRTVSGHVLGPDGSSICATLGDGALVRVRALAESDHGWFPAAAQVWLACPVNSFALDVPAAPIYLMVNLPAGPGLGTLPQSHTEMTPVDLTAGSATRDIRILEGGELPGSIVLDGAPYAGAPLWIWAGPPLIQSVPLVGAAGPDGVWRESWGRSPPRLQRDRTFFVTCPEALGAIVASGPLNQLRRFPDELARMDCVLRTPSPATAYTHAASRLVVTMLGGDIGGRSDDLRPQYGNGWGVQFPVAPGTPPSSGAQEASQMHRGGLIVGVPRGTLLPAFDLCGYEVYWPDGRCRGMGLDARGQVAHQGRDGRMITWRYSDAGSPAAVGLSVRQRSYDSRDGRDYVLLQFRFFNENKTPLTFYAGTWMDWDVDRTAYDDVGYSGLDDRVMVVLNGSGAGPWLGTVMASDVPVAGLTHYPVTYGYVSRAEFFRWVSGAVRRPSESTPGDIRSIHTAGPFTLPGRTPLVLWMALVAGENQTQMRDNVLAAQAAIAQRQAEADID
jgi:hypothetical protein